MTVLFKMFSWFRQWNQFVNLSIFDEVKAREVCQFLGHLLYTNKCIGPLLYSISDYIGSRAYHRCITLLQYNDAVGRLYVNSAARLLVVHIHMHNGISWHYTAFHKIGIPSYFLLTSLLM